jgi:hypothetical protein
MQKVLTMPGEFDEHFATVIIAVTPPYGATRYEAIDEFHRAVMPQKQLPGQRGYSGACAAGQAFDGKEKLVLVRLDTFGTRGFFAEMEELPDTTAEFGELTKTRF